MRSRHTDCVFFAVQRGPRRKVPRGKRRRSSFFAEWAYLSVPIGRGMGRYAGWKRRAERRERISPHILRAYPCTYISRLLLYTRLLQHTASRSGVRMTGQPVSAFCLRTCLPAPSFCNLPGACLFCACGRHCFFAVHPRPFTPRSTFSVAPDASRVRRRNGRGAGRGMDRL